ncbi:hypothetical protein BDZ45DRAFT_701519 [Acephala macrosclerotiorum]|nr:hypothetical protein BDZ45DRAFT_701519 [Acephala macrosclerotiorum]
MSESAGSNNEKSYEDIALVQGLDTEVGKTTEIVSSDDELLREIEYKQEFKREFTRLSTLSYAISIMGIFGSVPATYAVPLSAQGPATAGGMYFVTKYVVPKKRVPLASWIVGQSNFFEQTTGVTSVGYFVGQMLLAAYAMGSNYDETTGTCLYTLAENSTAEHTVSILVAILIIMGIICSFPTKWLHEFIMWFDPVNIIASVAICIALLVLNPNLNPPSEVFGNVTYGSNWNSKVLSFVIGLLLVAWAMTDYDATTHISEETKQAAIRGPVAITQAVISLVVRWLLNVTFGFCAGDVTTILSSGLGNPVAQIFYNANSKKVALAMWFWAILIQFFTRYAAMLADTRIIFSITAPALECSYMAVVELKLCYSDQLDVRKGPFTLGRWSRWVNYVALAQVVNRG